MIAELDVHDLCASESEVWHDHLGADGVAIRIGDVIGLVAPAHSIDAWLTARYGATGAQAITELACIVYRRKRWFDPTLHPLTLRDRRPDQYEIRIFREDGADVWPLLALDLAPLIATGHWRDLDQRTSNPVASLLEIARVPSGQSVVIDGACGRLDDVAFDRTRLCEVGRLGSLVELVRSAPTPEELELDAIRSAHRAAEGLMALTAHSRRGLHVEMSAAVALSVSWVFARLPIDLVVGLSQGDVVQRFVGGLPGGRSEHCVLFSIDEWHESHCAFRYAPGYFATGAVRGYALDGVAMRRDLPHAALHSLHSLVSA